MEGYLASALCEPCEVTQGGGRRQAIWSATCQAVEDSLGGMVVWSITMDSPIWKGVWLLLYVLYDDHWCVSQRGRECICAAVSIVL